MFRFAVIALAFTCALQAQETIRFLAERAPVGLGQMRMSTGDKRSAPFDLPTNHLSEPMPVPAREFQLRAVQPDVALATLTLPEGGKSFVAILIPDPKGGYKPVVMRADDPGFKAGDVYFYNHAAKTILGYVGSAKFELPPASGKTLRPAGARAENFYDVGFGVREESQNRVLSTTRWPVDPTIRSYVFFFINPSSKRLDFRAVDEFVPPETGT